MIALPPYIDAEAWSDYEAMRKRIKKPLTARSARIKLKLLHEYHVKGHDVNQVIDTATERCWLDFYEPRKIEISDQRPNTARVTGEAALYMSEEAGKPSEAAREALRNARTLLKVVG